MVSPSILRVKEHADSTLSNNISRIEELFEKQVQIHHRCRDKNIGNNTMDDSNNASSSSSHSLEEPQRNELLQFVEESCGELRRLDTASGNSCGYYELSSHVVKSCPFHLLRQLSKVYITISMDQLAAKLSLASVGELESLLMKLFSEGVVKGKMDEVSNTVTFFDPLDTFPVQPSALTGMQQFDDSLTHNSDTNRSSIIQELETQLEQSVEICEQLRAKYTELITSKEYVSKQLGLGGGGSSGGVGMSMMMTSSGSGSGGRKHGNRNDAAVSPVSRATTSMRYFGVNPNVG